MPKLSEMKFTEVDVTPDMWTCKYCGTVNTAPTSCAKCGAAPWWTVRDETPPAPVVVKPTPTPDYDPSIFGLISQCLDDWGDQEVNRQNLVPYGIKPIDQALYGLDTYNGELDLILGPEKQRKTTLALNILANYMTADKPKDKPFTVVDALESGMNPKRYRDSLISIMATRYLLQNGHRTHQNCPACYGPTCKHMGISPEFLRYNSRTETQERAIEYAMDTIASWPLYIYGANPIQGNTRNLKQAVGTDQQARWQWLIQEMGAKIFIVDHVQQYAFSDGFVSDYEKQIRAVSAIGSVVAQWQIVVLLLSQVSLTSLREARTGDGNLNAAGGKKAQEEANVVISTSYASGTGKMKIAIEESRKSPTFAVWQPLEDTSGTFYGEATKGGADQSYD